MMSIIKEKKSFQRTIRMTERVRFILESYKGNGMNEKFENLILDCNEKIPQIEDEVNNLQKKKERLLKEIAGLKDLKDDLKEIEIAVERAKKSAKSLAEK